MPPRGSAHAASAGRGRSYGRGRHNKKANLEPAMEENHHGEEVGSHKLVDYNCAMLPSLPSSTKRLVTRQKLENHNCDELDLMEQIKEAMVAIKSLESIELVEPRKLIETFPGSLESASPSLVYLKVSECKEVMKLPDFIKKFSSEKIEIPERRPSSGISWDRNDIRFWLD